MSSILRWGLFKLILFQVKYIYRTYKTRQIRIRIEAFELILFFNSGIDLHHRDEIKQSIDNFGMILAHINMEI